MISGYDVIVVGGGHGGAEAANAAAKMGAKTLLITMSKDTIAKMSCNPAIGGIAKGQIVREIDALGGVMGIAIDATGIQFRILNSSKGPAVQSPRAQADKYKYKDFVRQYLEQIENLDIVEGMACDIIVEGGTVAGVKCADGSQYAAKAVIITAGTFLRGLMHIGDEQFPGGRLDEPASNELSVSLERLGLTLGRLKTGTPARLDAKTIDYDKCEAQYGDNPAVPFSFLTETINQPQLPCWITYTNPEIHQLLKQCIDEGRSPLYSGQILSTGARYCPSIETKIMRFADKTRHMVFLEPEDSQNSTIYCNGISTSVPRDVQEKMFKLLPGTENARIVHYAYAIEYNFCPPQQLKINLETKIVKGLFLAGQVNGTSGYEEAAGQGLMAGINAVRMLQNKEPFVLRRDQAYIGVMIDDLLTRGVDEPYRMFTSRAEYRLLLRSDNADRRLTEAGREIGLVDDNRWAKFSEKMQAIENIKAYLHKTRTGGQSLWEHLKKPQNTLTDLIKDCAEMDGLNFSGDIIEAVSIDAKYEGYLARQEKVVENFRKLENQKLPENIDYYGVPHLRAEAKEKLTTFKPYTLAQAGRISGITPADITVLQVYLKHTKA
jgi:tRNA uridine 5-carboxymethylaminomethyl modification enzyme